MQLMQPAGFVILLSCRAIRRAWRRSKVQPRFPDPGRSLVPIEITPGGFVIVSIFAQTFSALKLAPPISRCNQPTPLVANGSMHRFPGLPIFPRCPCIVARTSLHLRPMPCILCLVRPHPAMEKENEVDKHHYPLWHTPSRTTTPRLSLTGTCCNRRHWNQGTVHTREEPVPARRVCLHATADRGDRHVHT
jgi:hypothetical protein